MNPGSLRKRVSYQRFHELATFLSTDRSPAEILLQVHSVLDEWEAFRSGNASRFALESVHAVLRDFGWAPADTQEPSTSPGALRPPCPTSRSIGSAGIPGQRLRRG